MYETPWKVIGYEKYTNENGTPCVRLFCIRSLTLAEGHEGEGLDAGRVFYKPQYLKTQYEPQIGQRIIAVEGRYGIDQIFVVGYEKPAGNGQ